VASAGAVDRRPLVEAHDPGRGSLGVVRCGGRSVVSRAYATSPLRLLTPINHGPGAWVFTSTFGGGLVDGDRLALEIDVGDHAMALVSTQASTKIYRSPRGTVSTIDTRIGRDALLVMLPDPVVCFAASRYRQGQRFDLADGGNLVLLDWITAGRRAAGERWAFTDYVAQIAVKAGRRWLVNDSLALRASDGNVAARLGRFDVLAVIVVVGPMVAAAAGRIVAQVNAGPLIRRADQIVAATAIEGGCVVRVAGRSVEQTAQTIRGLLDFVPVMLGDDPWARKW
jgi:urease accessory protein